MIITITPAKDATADTAAVPALLIDSDAPADITTATYVAATTGEKSKIRNAVTNAMHDAVRSGDFAAAKSWSDVAEIIKSVKTTTATETDFNRVVADRIAALRMAADMIESGAVTPDGIDAEKIDMDTVRTMTANTDTESIMTSVARMASAKIARNAERGDIESLIIAAFDGLPVGTKLTVAQIKTRSGAASGGAIAARLWPTPDKSGNARSTTLDLHAMGVELSDVDGTRAVKKVA